MGRNAELEEFLKRVEDYDLQRKGNNNNDAVKINNTTNHNGMNYGYSEESLERAKKLLSENGVEIVEEEPGNNILDAPELAYKSAYNYEKTFSPKRSTMAPTMSPTMSPKMGPKTSPKTYTVSEDDYFLLQRLKAKEKPALPLPPYEKPRDDVYHRDNYRLRALLDDVSIPYFPSTATTSLPTSNYYNKFKLESKKTELPHVELPRNKEPPPVPPKPRSKTKDELETAEKVTKEAKEPNSSSPAKPSSKVELKSSPRKLNLNAELGSPEKTLTLNNDRGSSQKKEPRPSSQLNFLDSIQKNKTDLDLDATKSKYQPKSFSLHSNQFIDSAVHKLPSPTKPAKPLQLVNGPKSSLSRTDSESYISSALKISPSVSNVSRDNHANFRIPSKPSSETFINSALKTSPPPPPLPARKITNATIKRRPLVKPASLRESSTTAEDDTFKSENHEKLTQLRPSNSNEKPKPRVPPKKSELVLPKLRHVNPSDSRDTKTKQEIDFTSNLKRTTPPEVPKKNPSLPEALTRLGNLSRADPPPKRKEDVPEALTKLSHLSKPPPSPKKAEDIPEAFAHLEKLNKVSKQPPVPPRKISMGEALQKVQELKKQQKLHQEKQEVQEEEQQPKDVKSELGAVLMAQKARSFKPSMSNTSITEPSSNNSSTTTVDSGNRSSSLNHANKTRSKGPKRRIPSSIKK